MTTKKRRMEDFYESEPNSNPKKKRKLSSKNEMDGHLKKKPTKWFCQKIWDFQQNGGIYDMKELSKALTFLNEKGFVVIRDVIDEKENGEGMELLLNDLKEINKNKPNLNINTLNEITNKQLPGWASSGIRLQFSISHGQFAHFSRLRPNIKKIFAYFHECNENELNCSWDSIAVTPFNGKHKNTLWLHADQSMYNDKDKKISGWNYKSIQGALYYTATNSNTVSFVASSESHKTYWDILAEKTRTKTKHWVLIEPVCTKENFPENHDKMKQDILDNSYRIHVPKNSFLLWDSKCFHQNGDALNKNNNNNNNGMKRIASFICMAPNKVRDYKAFKNSLIYAINGSTSTHWPQFMKAHGSKHPRFTKGNCYENMCDIKPTLNTNITENQFKKMIPFSLLNKQIKIYNSNETKPLSLETVHHLNIRDLNKFKVSDLWNLIDPKLKVLQPWMDEK